MKALAKSRSAFVLLPFLALLLLGAGRLLGPREAEEKLLDRRYQEAARELSALLEKAPPGAERERMLFLLGEARLLSGAVDKAAEAFDRLLKESPRSPWADRAAFGKAEALAGAKRFREAAEILEKRVGALVSEKRKEQVAGVYLRLAAKALEGERPDHRKARTFYDLALGLGLRGSRAEEVSFLAASEAFECKDYADAARRLEAFLKKRPDSARLGRATYLLGESYRRSGRLLEARRVFREGAKKFRGTKEAAKCLYGLGKTFGMPRPGSEGALSQGVGAYRELIRQYPGEELAPKAALEIARALVFRGKSSEGLEEAKSLLARFEKADPAVLSEAQALVGDILRSQGKYQEAIRAYRDYLSKYPDQGKWRAVQAAVVECEYEEAQAERRKGKDHFDRAIELFRRFLERHPLDRRAADTVLLIGKMEMERKRWKAAREALAECASRFPRTDAAGEALYLSGKIYADELSDPVKAIETWKKVTWGAWSGKARAAMKKLREPSLALYTERVYRTDEKPRFTVETRNIPKLRVRVFKLDLGTFFRATHTASDIERLRIEVIEPDKTFESAVEGYKPFVETRREVEVPFRGPGAYVVKVDDGKLEAATLVVVSDLALVAKASRAGLFMFTENTRKESPEGGADVVVSDGKKILVEGKTKEDGSFRWKDPALLSARELRIFAVAKDGSGASTVGLSGLGAPRGLEAKGMVTVDRPAYRPGEKVRVKAYLRDVEGGVYVLPRVKEYEIGIYTPSGRRVAGRRVKAGEFGTVWGVFDLPGGAPLGWWRVEVRQAVPGGRAFTGRFRVARYQVPQVKVEVEPASRVVMRGEPLKGTVRVSWFYGEPLAGEPVEVRVSVPGGTLTARGRTDEAGRFSYDFDTRDIPGERRLMVTAYAPGRNASGRAPVLVASVGMTLGVSVLRDVYLRGEEVEARVEAKDRLGKGVAAKVLVTLYRKVEGPGGVLSEVKEAEKKATTGGERGTALVSFTPKEGGRYVIRASGEDRFGNPVSGDAGFFVSGAKDKVKLRLLTDRERWRVGEKARVRVVNRAGRHLALFTTEAEGVQDWWAEVLPEGESRFDFAFRRKHAPNIRLAVCMAAGNRFYQASRDFLVDQALRVEVEPASREGAPGGVMPVSVKVTDPSGKPVEAELALSVLDEGLLALFPESWRKIDEFFYGARRAVQVRTAASCTFKFRGKTRKVPQELRKEEQRLRYRAEEIRKAGELAKLLKDARRQGFLAAKRPAPAGNAPASPALKRGFLRSRKKQLALEEKEAELYDKDSFNDVIGMGGGAGGHGKFGGRSWRRRSGGGGLPSLRSEFPQTALWLPSLKTGPDGKGRVEIPLPGNLTTWRVRVRGITRDTLVGQGEASFKARKPLLVEVQLPARAVEGDRIEPVASVRNLTDKAVTAEVEIPSAGFVKKVEIPAGGSVGVPFTLTAEKAGELSVTVRASGGGYSDAVTRKLTVDPLGTWRVAAASGLETRDRDVSLSLPAGKEYTRRVLEVTIGGRVRSDLLKAALAQPRPWRCLPAQTMLGRVCRGLGALAALELAGRGTVPEDTVQQLRDLVDSVLAELAARERVGWSWNGKGAPDPVTTVEAVRFLARAEALGFRAAPGLLERGRSVLKGLFPRARNRLEQARILEALAASGEAPLVWLNALRRSRQVLEAPSLALLVSAYCESGRPEGGSAMAARLRSLAKKAGPGQVTWGEGVKEAERKVFLPLEGALETTALAVKALLQVDPADPLAREGAEWIYAHWHPGFLAAPLDRAAALDALCFLEGKAASRASEGEVRVFLAGKLLGRVPLGAGESRLFRVEGGSLPEGSAALSFRIRGRGRYLWRAELKGLTKGIDSDLRNKYASFERTVLAAPMLYEGRPLAPGFTVVEGPVKKFENLADKVAVGRTVRVRLRIAPPKGNSFRGHLVVTDELPGGCALVPGSVRGPVELVREGRGRVTFFVGSARGAFEIWYDLSGYVPGSYRVLPAGFYPVENPGRITECAPGRVEVLRRGGKTGEKYRMTPDELYRLGLMEFERRRFEAAAGHLGDLMEGWRLRPAPLKRVARALLDLAARGGEPKRVVHAFEVLRQAWPGVELPFDQVMQVGRAYVKLGEFERAREVFLAVAEGSFMKEVRVAGTLEAQGEALEAARYTLDLCLDYPALPVVRQAFLAMGQELARKASALGPGERLGEGGPGKAELLGKALGALREFLVLHPQDPRAPEATFAIASDWLSLKRWKEALSWASAGERRYARTRWADELLYLEGYAQFALKRYEESLKTLDRVAKGRFPDGRGNLVESDSKWLALYLMGQIHHALGHRAEAEKYYAMVKDRFPDAAENLAFLKRKVLRVPEVTVLKPGAPGEVELSWRNLEGCQIRIYRVDLLRLYVLQGSLSGLGGVQLAGIRPFKEVKAKLGGGGFLGEGSRKVVLPLEKPGAYLLVAQSSDQVASGLVLRSGLDLKVSEDPATGGVSVYVMEKGKPVSGAYVKIVGDGDRRFRSGETDLRGVYSTEGVRGRATVLVKAGEEYAFHRGERVLLPSRVRYKAAPRQTLRTKADRTRMLESANKANAILQREARKQLDQIFRNSQQGVRLK